MIAAVSVMQDQVTLRRGTLADAPFLAQIEEIAATPPFPVCPWQELADIAQTPLPNFLTAMFTARAHAWGEAEDFLILEHGGEPVAACAVFEPDPNAADRRPLRLSAIPAMGAHLGWGGATTAAVIDAFDNFWPLAYTDFLWPQAPAIIECVGVLAQARGLGLGRRLMLEAFREAEARGHNSIGIMVIEGNHPAQQLYESVGFAEIVRYTAAYFEGQHPAVIKYRRPLS